MKSLTQTHYDKNSKDSKDNEKILNLPERIDYLKEWKLRLKKTFYKQ